MTWAVSYKQQVKPERENTSPFAYCLSPVAVFFLVGNGLSLIAVFFLMAHD
jgi:hypothetical protein